MGGAADPRAERLMDMLKVAVFYGRLWVLLENVTELFDNNGHTEALPGGHGLFTSLVELAMSLGYVLRRVEGYATAIMAA